MTQKSPEKTPKKPLAESTGASLRKRRSKLPADTTVKPARLPDLAPEKGGSPAKPTSIVGIGASAGGFEAFQQLLGQLPADTGLAFVLVQHLDPTHQSKLSELLSRSSPMPVREVKNGVKVEPNQIYVIPHNCDLSVSEGHLRLTPRNEKGPHLPVDGFFRSLARELKEQAIGVILSGNGADGTSGLQEIKGNGGITFAQNETTSKFFGMPSSAIASGCVDFVLPPEAIARELGRIAHHPLLRSPATAADTARRPMPDAEDSFGEYQDELSKIFALLRRGSGVDFSLYKPSTLKRRILRRMVLQKLEGLSDYIKLLLTNPAEVGALFNDFLISVTSFFREPHVFETLKKRILVKLLKSRPPEAPIRIWVCGCSTGEEAYSLAIALVELMNTEHNRREVQIFATDINEAALQKARAGLYPENIQLAVSPERLRRFFVKVDGNYQVNKIIRDMCVFARQNILADAPFSHLDLISCRNVLIYFGAMLQKRIIPTFHYALKPDGFLLLGASETISASSDLFSLVDKKNKIYSKKPDAFRPSHFFAAPFAAEPKASAIAEAVQPVAAGPIGSPDLQEHVDRILLSKYSPAAIVVNRQLDVLQFRGHTGLYLEHAPGAASLNVLKMAREGLVLELRTAVTKAIRTDLAIKQQGVRLKHNGYTREISIEVVPFRLPPSTERLYLVLFEEVSSPSIRPSLLPGKGGRKAQKESQRMEITNLTEELAWTRQSLQAIIAEQEATNEEFKSANEEIQSSNEELQSTNEELETAKEELQSTNEELTTLNEELQNRNSEMSQVNNDLTNLLSSVNMAIVMLGSDLTIRRFTPAAERVFNLIPSDLGRRFSDLSRSIILPDLQQLIENVIENLVFVDREVQDTAGHWYSLRIRPYRTRENKIDGAVLLLVDLDEHIVLISELMSIVNQPLLALRPDLRVKSANRKFYDTFKVKPEETENRFIYELGNGQWNIPQLRTLLEEILPRNQSVNNYGLKADFPYLGARTMLVSARKCYEDDRSFRSFPLILLSIEDVTGKA